MIVMTTRSSTSVKPRASGNPRYAFANLDDNVLFPAEKPISRSRTSQPQTAATVRTVSPLL